MTEGARQRVLVLEDEDPLRRLWLRLLDQAGYDAAGAGRTAPLRELLAVGSADLLIADVHLPGESGMTFVRELRAEHPEVAVLMVSGMGDAAVAAEAIRLGAAGYLLKPVSPKQLLLSVSNALSKRTLDLEHDEERARLEGAIDARDEALEAEREHRQADGLQAESSARRARERDAVVAALTHRAARFEALSTFQRSLPLNAGVDELASELARAVCELIGAHVGEVSLLDPDNDSGVGLFARHPSEGPVRAQPADGVAARALSTGAVAVAASQADSDPTEIGSRAVADGVQFAVAVPLRSNETLVGALMAGSRQPEGFSDFDQDLMLMLAEHASFSLAVVDAGGQVRRSLRDPLTGLPTRLAFVEAVRDAVAATPDEQAPPAVAVIGIDAFLTVSTGPPRRKLLRQVGAALNDLAPGPIADLGHGRFAVLIADEAGRVDPMRAVEPISQAVSKAVKAAAGQRVRTASVGVAYGDRDPDLLLSHAGVALVRARRGGGGQCERYVPENRGTLRARLSLDADLVRAAHGGEITARYQPIVSLSHRSLHALRMIPRWAHVAGGRLPPAIFMPLAEEIGLAPAIGNSLLRQACADGAEWGRRFRAKRPLPVSVPLPGAAWRRAQLIGDVRDALRATGLQPGKLILEIDEHTAATADAELLDTVEAIAATGARLAINDFGSGAVPLDYLEALPVGMLRLSRSLVDGFGDELDADDLIRSTVELARSYGFEIVAQGIERPQQIVKLRGAGCDYGEGSIFSRPLEAHTVTTMFQRGSRAAAILPTQNLAG